MSKMLRLGALVLALTLVLAACGNGFSDEIRDEFMASCVPAEGVEFCECTLDGLEKASTTEEFLGSPAPQKHSYLILQLLFSVQVSVLKRKL